MRVVIAPDSFKESLSAQTAARCIEAGFREIFPAADYRRIPMADGGEGTVEALVAATGGRLVTVEVTGPLGEPVQATYGICGDHRTAVIEMAAASGLALVPPDRRDPTRTTSYGTGEMIRHALDAGLKKFIIGIGGSATSDGGMGMLQALGARFLDGQGRDLGAGGGALGELARIDPDRLDARLQCCHVEVACDVDNPLLGPRGAAQVYAPQKGATPEMVAQLEAGLARYAERLREDLGCEVVDVPGAGAAGGMGAGLLAFLDPELRPGIEIVIAASGLLAALEGADLVITGEGRIDGQSIAGKTPVGVARAARARGVPVVALAGSLGDDAGIVLEHGLDAIFSILPGPCQLEEALQGGDVNLRCAARNLAAAIRLGQSIAATT